MQKRNPLLILLLSVVTLGIYTIYWLYATRKELLTYIQDEKAIWPVWYLLAPFLALILAAAISFAAGDNSAIRSLVFLIGAVAIVGFLVIPFMWTYKFSKAVHAVAGQMDTSSLFMLFVVVSILGVGVIWPTIAQIDINKFIDRPQQPVAPTPQIPPQQPVL